MRYRYTQILLVRTVASIVKCVAGLHYCAVLCCIASSSWSKPNSSFYFDTCSLSCLSAFRYATCLFEEAFHFLSSLFYFLCCLLIPEPATAVVFVSFSSLSTHAHLLISILTRVLFFFFFFHAQRVCCRKLFHALRCLSSLEPITFCFLSNIAKTTPPP